MKRRPYNPERHSSDVLHRVFVRWDNKDILDWEDLYNAVSKALRHAFQRGHKEGYAEGFLDGRKDAQAEANQIRVVSE